MSTNFKITTAIDELTKNTSFVQNLLRSGKAQKNLETSVIEYILTIEDFNQGDQDNLNYVKEELKLTNNNWGYLKFNDAYERISAYCIKIQNVDDILTLDIGFEDESKGLTKVRIPFEITFKESKIQKGTKKAEYTLQGKPCRLVTEVKEDKVHVQSSSVVITLDELEVEIPLYRVEEVNTMDSIWDLWNSGRAHLIAQKPRALTYYSNQIFKTFVSDLLSNKKEFPKEGVAFLIGNPIEVEVQKNDGTGSFWKTDWEVFGCSHPTIQGINAYQDKNGNDVVKSYYFGEIKNLSFNRSSNADTPYATWVNSGSLPMVGIVWFTGFNKNPNHIPKHKMYPLVGDDYDLPDRFIDLQEKFLEEIDTISQLLIESNNEKKTKALVASMTPEAIEFGGLTPMSEGLSVDSRPDDLQDAELHEALETFG